MSIPANEQPSGKLWTKDFVLNLLTAHFLFASYTSLFTIIPPYVLDQGGQEWQIGVVVGSFGIAGFVIRPFAGRWINVLGARRVAIIGAIIFAVASLLYIPSFSVWWLVPVRMLQGIGLAMGPVATSTTVANLAPPRKLGAAMSYMSNMIAVSNLYAPVAGFWIITQFGFAPGFLFSAVAAVLSGVTAWMMSSPRPAAAVDRTAAKVPLVSRSAIFPTVVFLSYTFTTAPVNAFLPLLAEERNLGNPGLYFAVFSFTMMVVLLFSGGIADKVGRAAVIVPGMLATAAGMFVLSGAPNQLVFLTAALLVGVGFGLIQPGIQSLVIDRAPPRERSAAVATLQSAWDIGGSGGSFLLGPVAAVTSIAVTFALVGGGAVAGVAGFVLGNSRKRGAPTSGQDASVAD